MPRCHCLHGLTAVDFPPNASNFAWLVRLSYVLHFAFVYSLPFCALKALAQGLCWLCPLFDCHRVPCWDSTGALRSLASVFDDVGLYIFFAIGWHT